MLTHEQMRQLEVKEAIELLAHTARISLEIIEDGHLRKTAPLDGEPPFLMLLGDFAIFSRAMMEDEEWKRFIRTAPKPKHKPQS